MMRHITSYTHHNILFGMTKPRRMGQSRHVTFMGDLRNPLTNSVWKPEGMGLLGRPR
jgi:hypothetical protein